MEKKEFLEDIQLAYTNALINIMSKWVHDDDGANNHYQCQVKQVETYNEIMLIYQPEKQDDWVENAFVIITPVKDSKLKITEELWNELTPLIDEVEYRFIDSVNDFIRKFGGWIEESNNLSFDRILDIQNPLHFKNGKLVMKFGIGCYINIPLMCWTPVKLVEWMFSLPSYKKYRKCQIEKDQKDINENIMKMKAEIDIHKEELNIAYNQIHYLTLQEKITRLETCIKESEEFKHRLIKADKVEDLYNYSEQEYKEYEKYYKVEKMVPYKKPMKLKVSLSGRKRNFDQIEN